MTAEEVVEELRSLGSETTKKTFLRHGAREPFFGVKIEDLKKIRKRVGTDYQLAIDLYDTGNTDAMYLAGLVADDPKMTKANLRKWVKGAYWSMLSGYTVPWVASGSNHGRELAAKWIESKTVTTATCGWATLASLASITDDDDLDLDELQTYLDRVRTTIHDQPDRVRYVMNGFVIAIGSYVPALTESAVATAREIGPVSVDMGETSCQVPFAPDYIEKVRIRGTIGKKRKSAKC